MKRRTAVAPIVAGALVLVAVLGGASPAAHPDPWARTLDLVASAHPTSAEPSVSDTAYAAVRVRGPAVEADTAALTSTTCDGCVGESTALHVVYVPRARRAGLDNVATAWAQECQGCTSTALSVQVVVLAGRPEAVPNNRALSLTAACDGCRTSALAFQVVLVADRAAPLGAEELAGLRAWVDEQAALLRASVAAPLPDPPTTEATPTPTPTETPTETPSVTVPSPSPAPSTSAGRPVLRDPQRLRRDAVSAIDELEALLTAALPAVVASADVDVSR
ncbi:hypothetical protein SAMN05192575_1011054 [Nocardioides alpinus]|uniref:Meckel syndrome type 1 protein n=1 Tax=Nocardioides alpinus TaxID=748909 RepID=A0A1I0WJD3_9ACTN|nr:hypothetical protein [Nocardioides alpinus]PKH37968.1 hypothetical protein CXG46_21580 [Nocardioides alpinus]SFA88862.1 hypothetical protein SAMN05192575_1011054 [Nocardioides alpinus]